MFMYTAFKGWYLADRKVPTCLFVHNLFLGVTFIVCVYNILSSPIYQPYNLGLYVSVLLDVL